MLQYIINSTAIWLTGLIVFDIFLRREAIHGYNRLYLLILLLAGALIPLWSWGYDSVIYSNAAGRPLAEQTAAMRDAIVSGSEQELLGWEQWLQIVYLAGVAICSLLLLKDIFIILKMYSKGDKSKDGTWIIVETGASMSPFSAFRVVFISAKEDYTKEELAMVLAHEEQHGHLLHFIDVLIIRLFQILFWFNPMTYLLEKRLLLVHEYQADLAVENNPSEYGRFLVEQSVLNAAPVLAHSFIRSPLKKRILMLTRKTTTLARGKQLLIAPVLLLSLLCFTKNAFSGEEPQKDGNKITYKGNVFEVQEFPPDTAIVVDPVTGEERRVIYKKEGSGFIKKMNNEEVYNTSHQGATIEMRNTENKIKMEIGVALSSYAKKLGKGNFVYDLFNVVVDTKGKIVYYELKGIEPYMQRYGQSTDETPIPDDIKAEIDKVIVKTLEQQTKAEQLVIDGKAHIYSIRIQDNFTVR
ncbi:MAG: M56 family metallopeptidase [Taibaiella sp.]|nr:M56 family metallopeptidase [Taibaiella sp.]